MKLRGYLLTSIKITRSRVRSYITVNFSFASIGLILMTLSASPVLGNDIKGSPKQNFESYAETSAYSLEDARIAFDSALFQELYAQSIPVGDATPPSQSSLGDSVLPTISESQTDILSVPDGSLNTDNAETVSAPNQENNQTESTVEITRFDIVDGGVFSDAEWKAVTAGFLGRSISFAELLEVRSLVTQHFIDEGYITTGAYLPAQAIDDNTVEIQVVPGSLEEINITGEHHLDPSYIRRRIALAGSTPLNVPRLVEGLQLLQQDPLIESLSAELSASPSPGKSILDIHIQEANIFNVQLLTDNNRSPSVGSLRRQVQIGNSSLFGQGDAFNLAYTNTRGSNAIDVSYAYPFNASNGKLILSYGQASSNVVEDPFSILDIESESRYYEASLRQPIIQTPKTEFALGISYTRRESENVFLEDLVGRELPFLTSSSDDAGKTKISALRFTQDWSQRDTRQVLALRSQLSLGLGGSQAVNTINAPDTNFIAWRGQGQWISLLDSSETKLKIKADIQISGDPLVPFEQFSLGGQDSVRGYRQDFLLTDSGALLSAELEFPIASDVLSGDLSLSPFIDMGVGWNSKGESPDDNMLAAVGVGLSWQLKNYLTAKVEWGIPLTAASSRGNSLQESGIYFSARYNPSF